MSFNQDYHIEIQEGTTFTHRYYLTNESTGLPINLTECAAHMVVRRGYEGFSDPEQALVFDSGEGGGIVLGGTAGTIDLTIEYGQTEGLLWNKGVYDLLLFPAAGGRLLVAKGLVTILPSITRLP